MTNRREQARRTLLRAITTGATTASSAEKIVVEYERHAGFDVSAQQRHREFRQKWTGLLGGDPDHHEPDVGLFACTDDEIVKLIEDKVERLEGFRAGVSKALDDEPDQALLTIRALVVRLNEVQP